MNEVIINDLFGYKKFSYLEDVLNFTFKKLNIENKSVSVILVDENYIKEINRMYRDKDAVTDVISFAFLDSKDLEEEILLGDIYICVPRMKKQALEFGHSEKRELSFLAIHGLLHLLGYDHMNKNDEEVMFGLQEEILSELKIERG